MLAGSPRFTTDWHQRVLNAAARVITGTQRFDHFGLDQDQNDKTKTTGSKALHIFNF